MRSTFIEKAQIKNRSRSLIIAGTRVLQGATCDLPLKISETYTGTSVEIPVHVMRAKSPGPTLLVTGAVHGDELVGVSIVRELLLHPPKLKCGSLVYMPVVNVFGFESHSRYLPDRRDLNRSFPGDPKGSLAARMAWLIFDGIIKHCDYAIDLHSAAVRRTNFPHIRADFQVPKLKDMAEAFGCEIVVNHPGSDGMLRSEACRTGCKTLLYEAGEALKFEPGMVELGVRGVLNVMKFLGMISGERVRPAYQTLVEKSVWVRANLGGILRFFVQPGDVVKKGQRLALCEKLLSEDEEVIKAPMDGVIIGMTTLPAVKPGEPIAHLVLPDKALSSIASKIKSRPKTLHRKIQDQLGTSFLLEDEEVEPTA